MKDLSSDFVKKEFSFVKIGEASKILGVSIDTLRRWEKTGKITVKRTAGGTRLYPLSVKIGDASKILGVSIDTLRRWEVSGKIKTIRTSGGTRLYPLVSLNKKSEISSKPQKSKVEPINILSTEELLKIANNPHQNISSAILTSFPVVSAETETHTDNTKKTLIQAIINKFLITTVMSLALILMIGIVFTASYFIQPTATQNFLKNNLASVTKLLRLIPPDEPPPLIISQQPNRSSAVLAVTSTSPFLEVNSNTQINGSLFVRDGVNGLSLEATPSAGTFALNAGTTTLTVTKKALLDQDVSTTATPTFNTLNLSATKDQLVFQSGGPTGTLTWTPTAARTITLPDVTTTLVGIDNTQTLTNKTINGSSNTITNISNSALANSKITITAGTNLTGGGDITLGSSATIALKDSPSITGTLTVAGATTLSSTLALTGAATLSSTLGVTGATTLSSTSLSLGGVSYTFPSSQGAAATALVDDGSGSLTWTSIATASGWSVSGSNVYLTTSSNNVGIGTATPGTKLAVIGNVGIGTSSTGASLQVNGAGLFGWGTASSTAPSNGLAVFGNVGIGTTSPVAAFQNSGGTLFGTLSIADLPAGGNIGSATSTVDIYTSFNLTQTTAGQTITLPNPTNLTSGRLIYLSNTGTTTFTFYGSTVKIGDTTAAMWDGDSWNLAGGGGLSQGTVANSTLRWNSSTSQWVENTTALTQTNPTADSSYGLQVTNTGAVSGTGYGGFFSKTGASTTNIALYATATGATNNYAAIFNGGNVGIGVTNPGSALTVIGNVGIGTSSTGASLQVNGAGLFGWGTAAVAGSNNGLAVSGNVGIGTTTANSNLSVVGNTHIGSLYQGITAPTNGLFVDGNVGIGATTSSNKLDVWGSARITSGLTLDGLSSSAATALCINSSNQVVQCSGSSALTGTGVNGGVTYWSGTSSLSNSVANFYWDSGNNRLGIGTSAPSQSFQVNTNTSNPVVITSGGNVGIGTTSPATKLEITGGNVTLTDGKLLMKNNQDIQFKNSAGTYKSAMYVSTSDVLTISNDGLNTSINPISGNVGIGTSSPTFQLQTTGNVGIGGSLTVSSGLSLPNSSILNSYLVNSSINVSATAGTGLSVSGSPVSLGGTLTLAGIDASTTVKGVASFNSTNFTVSSGAVNTIQDIATSATPTFVGLNTTSGNVGIGTSATGSRLAVNGAGIFGWGTAAVVGPNNGLAVFGNVGIGTTSPTNPLTVIGNANVTGTLTAGGLTNTGVFLAPNGSASAPSYSFTNLTNAGLWTNGDGLLLTTGGSNTSGITVTGTGNVGIGTTTPHQKLEVQGVVLINTTFPQGSEKLTIDGSMLLKSGGAYQLVDGANAISLSSGQPLNISGYNGVLIPNHTGNVARFGISAASIDSYFNGNVGIGFTSPNQALQVASAPSAATSLANILGANGSQLALTGSTATTLQSKLALGIDTTNNFGYLQAGNSSTNTAYNLALEPNGGNVGIGTTSPQAKLDVAGNIITSAGGNLSFNSVNATNGIWWAGLNDSSWGSIYRDTATGQLKIDGQTNILLQSVNSGNVGIGATTSSNKLDVWGNSRIAGNLTVDGTLTTGAQSIAGNLLPTLDNTYSLGSTSLRWSSLHVGPGSVVVHNDATNTNWSKLDFAGSTAQLITDSSTPIQLVSGTNNLGMYINTSGNVGIGTTGPTNKLYVNDNTSYSYAANFQQQSATGYGAYVFVAHQSNTIDALNVQGWNGSAVVPGLDVKGNGNVGIGTTSPTQKFELVGANMQLGNNSTIMWWNNANNSAKNIMKLDNSNIFQISNASSDIRFVQENFGTALMTIQNGGNVGIGTTSPAAKLDVNGAIKVTSCTGCDPVWLTSGNNIGYLNGSVGIGTTGPVRKLDVTAAKVTDGGLSSQLSLTDTTAYNSSPISGLQFTGQYTSGGALAGFSGIAGGKENATDANFAGYLTLYSRANGGSIAEALRINSSGNVGIGTTGPALKFEIAGVPNGAPAISGTSQTGGFRLRGALPLNNTLMDMGIAAGGNTNAWLQVTNATDLSAKYNLLLNPNGGNVGIGTAGPVTKVHVNAEVIDDNAFSYDSNSLMVVHQTPTSATTLNDPKTVLMLARQGTSGQAYGAAAEFDLSRYENVGINSRTRLDISLANASFDPSSNRVMTLLSSGNVGIGSAAPNANLSFGTGVNTNKLYLYDGSTDKYGFGIAGNTLQIYSGAAAGANSTIQFGKYDGSTLTEWARIINGNLGIGTIGPVSALDVNGTIRSTSQTIPTSGSGLEAVFSGGQGFLVSYNRSASAYLPQNVDGNILTLNGSSNGNVVIGGTGRARITTRTADGATAAYYNASGDLGIQSSDIRLKTNITPIMNSLDIIKGINGVTFNWLTDPEGAEKTVGVTAQDVMKVMPELTFSFVQDGETYYGVHYEKLGALLISGVNEQQTEINDLITKQASTSATLSNVSVDPDGTIVIPKIKVGQLILDPSIASASSSLTANGNQLALSTNPNYTSPGPSLASNTNNYIDLSGEIASLEDRIKNLESSIKELAQTSSGNVGIGTTAGSQATISTQIASSSASVASDSATIASNLVPSTSTLNLTPPDILLNSGSGVFTNLTVKSEASMSGQLSSYNLNVSNSLKSLGKTTLADTSVAGTLTVDGTLSIENGSEINVLGTLYLQKFLLASGVDIFNGKITIDSAGNITTQGKLAASEIKTNKLTISNTLIASGSATLAASIGTAKIPAGQTSVVITTNQATLTSKIFVTPRSKIGNQALVVETVKDKGSFTVSLDHALTQDIDFDWWVVQTN